MHDADSRQHVDEMAKTLKNKGIHILYKDKHLFVSGKDQDALYYENPDRIKGGTVAP